MVRCHHHGDQKVLNLSMGGQIYWGRLDWECMFKPDYRFGDERSRPEPNDARQTAPLPAIVRAILGTMTDTDIVREAVARQLGRKPKDITDADYRNVEQLGLSRTGISELEPLRCLTSLQRLYLEGTHVTDLGPLVSLTKLQVLCVANTQVKDLSPLKALVSLKEIHLGGTKVSDEQVMELQNTLRGLKVVRHETGIRE